MRFKDRYRRLSFWNRLVFWGSLASIIGLPLALLLHFSPDAAEPQLPRVETRLSSEEASQELISANRQLSATIDRYNILIDEIAKLRSESSRREIELQDIRRRLDRDLSDTIRASGKQRGNITFSEENLQVATVAAQLQQANVHSAKSTLEDDLISQRLRELEIENSKLQKQLDLARKYASTGNYQLLLEFLGSIQENPLAIGMIRTPENVEIYRPEDKSQFLKEIERESQKSRARSSFEGTYNPRSFTCSGAPTNCGGLIFEDEDSDKPKGQSCIDWYLGPQNSKAKALLAKLSGPTLRRHINSSRLAGMSACNFYRWMSRLNSDPWPVLSGMDFPHLGKRSTNHIFPI